MRRIALFFAVAAVLVVGPTAAAGPLQAASFTLTVSVTGSGHVTSSPAGINCPGTCSAKYSVRTSVSLAKNADTGWNFAGWGGSCSGSGGCTVVMSANHNVSAEFTPVPKKRYTLTVSVTGDGSVASSPGGIACPGDCSETYDEG